MEPEIENSFTFAPCSRGCRNDNAAPAHVRTADQSTQREAQPCLTILACLTAAMFCCMNKMESTGCAAAPQYTPKRLHSAVSSFGLFTTDLECLPVCWLPSLPLRSHDHMRGALRLSRCTILYRRQQSPQRADETTPLNGYLLLARGTVHFYRST